MYSGKFVHGMKIKFMRYFLFKRTWYIVDLHDKNYKQ